MPYKPTGRPPGRPKTKPEPAEKQAPVKEITPVHPAPHTHLTPPPPGRENFVTHLGELCAVCYPDGWPEGSTGLGCKHGSWTRRV